jgi:hypothetical protein
VHALRAGEGGELVSAAVVDCFGLEEDDEEGCGAGEGGLQPEDVAPGAEGYDYAADEGAWIISMRLGRGGGGRTEGWSN